MDTCHLPLQGLVQVLQQLLTLDIPWKEFMVQIRKACRKTGRTGLRMVRYFQEPILRAQSYISSYLERPETPHGDSYSS